jgi:predicted RNase H-like HicB family nuclease
MAQYRVLYTRARAGDWSASVRGLPRCRSRGRTLRQVRGRLRALLAAQVSDAYSIDLLEDVRLPAPARGLLIGHWKARRRLQREQARADDAARKAGQALVVNGVSVVDAADLLGVPVARLRGLWPEASGRGRRRRGA